MKYSLFAVVLIALTLAACGEPKLGNKPPSLYQEREGMLKDSDLESAKEESASKEGN